MFVATAGASAALAGLLFVAVSINVERILRYEGLPERAIETLAMLMAVLIVSVFGLMPGQGHVAIGAEVLGVGLAVLGIVLALPHGYTGVDEEPRFWLWGRWAIRLLATVPLLVAGASLLAESGGGLYWVAAGIVLAVSGSVANAWVLLVEILR
jgi:hypothetical protein